MEKTTPIRLEDQLCFQVYSANKKFNHFYQDALRPYSLTYPQYIALLTLWEYAPLSVKQLGSYLNLDSGTLTPLLKRLEANEWITRERSESDERSVQIDLTNKAKNTKNEVFNRVNSCMDVLGLTDEEKATCFEQVASIESKLDKYNESN
ncbi:MarR family transcriptional regulator [Lentilactobacillus sp. Marseille-Q4993]|uniref:MarR family winged helix-turn-helix transcriptional regulator n=1 Tax=Lentilactobacillus sp. Marseille-Q4993 TaxID=3039492 RepID=UPI0024BCE12B|nr:MarR family transcriptional regulator [Lentilactobacillus sp. Marseille-Q4993]